MDARLALGINISILLTLTIFTGLLVLPLKLLLDTNYNQQPANNAIATSSVEEENVDIKLMHRQLCPGDYKHLMRAMFVSNCDRNCTYINLKKTKKIEELKVEKEDLTSVIETNGKESATNLSGVGFKVIRPKAVPVTDHILALMLIVSVIGALVEILRIRFGNPQDSSVEGMVSRRSSIVELMLPRRCSTREPVRSQMSLDVPGLHRSPLRVMGSHTPPLIRRQSFPTYFSLAVPDDVMCDSPPRSPRRPSALVDNDSAGSSALHRRARLIRRH